MLLGKEIKKTVFSITFAVLLVALFAMPISQDVLNFSDKIITAPQQGEDYGIQQKEIPDVIMPAAFSSLYKEFSANQYTAYPIGFYKNVKLNNTDRQKMAEIISALSGVSANDLLGYDANYDSQDRMEINLDENQNYSEQKDGSIVIGRDTEITENEQDISVTLLESVSYEEFKEYMKRADDLIGGGSYYSENNLLKFCYVAVTYEEALDSYNLIASEDKFTGAYARLFCDYVGIILSILPVFIAVASCMKDRRAKMDGLIYSRKVSSFKLIFSRYFAIIIAVILPTLILAYISNISVWGQYSGMSLDYFAPLKYTIGWLMPSVMISTAVGMFFTELTGTPIAIAIQGLWWFIDLNMGVTRLSGVHTLFELTPRHNSLENTQTFLNEFQTLLVNRLIMAGVALLLILATVIIYEQKRRGRFNGYGKIKMHITSLANHQGKSAA